MQNLAGSESHILTEYMLSIIGNLRIKRSIFVKSWILPLLLLLFDSYEYMPCRYQIAYNPLVPD
jgi:hypothetical protein